MKTRIKELRASHNLTQEDLARKAGVRRETIVFLEQGKYVPSLKLAWDVAKALKIKIEDLVKAVIGKLGENITIARFTRFKLGEK